MWSILLNSNTQWVLLSTAILGIAAGTIGSLAYWKRQSLMSDALAHAALPGVIIAFLLFKVKHLFVLITGAAISAVIGAFFIQGIRSSTRIKEDTAMGMILSIFYGFGIMLLTIANRTSGNQSGLNNFILGQSASMVQSDVWTMSILAILVVSIVVIGFKEWKIYLFDRQFASGLGLPLKGMDVVYTILLVTTIVVGIQAVGVILIAALLIIPAVSARYWTHSFQAMVIISALFGGASGTIGTLISAIGNGWPTGPFIVVLAASFFIISLIFGKEKGILVQYWQMKRHKKQEIIQSIPTSVLKKEVQ
ncbi:MULTISPECIES: metal ABC transporter permease [Bacillaceae]|jgi:manganese/zinc/iron transport system permease protein|uniref:ABC transporter permease n=1 Tax=Caldibacillus thermoamylovorans TaxID=35841 RepID=A0A090IR81_9BACI|nr:MULTISPECIES: iron chelate uptake ABC transporter family permease subunit [Bacillaceae]MCM3054814.1 metal ABC transporter permease [Caldibacillus thermoamylovorans]MEC5272955.1 iron chelate uptake ABC transporter family permease subunit [Caldifermentibacillus hisashii]CEE00172.1 ABC transporter permease [Caldibacillus thermoamylovorans]